MAASIASTVGLGLLFASRLSWAQIDPYAADRPFGGFAPPIPGVIEAEEFDLGGQGVAYSDTTAGNKKNVFRLNEDVDIERLGTGFNVGTIAAGEYLRYTVDVTEDVEAFLFSFRVASSVSRGKFRLVAGGTGCGDFVVDLTKQVSVSSTGGFSKADYIDRQLEGQGLKAGLTYLWLCAEGPDFNIDSFMMTAYNPGAYGGVPAAIPGLIEAERFDVGGEGVAYTDTTARNIGNALRPDEAVDVYHLGNGFIVGSTATGEYLRYTVDVTEDVETFLYSFRVASDRNTGKFRIVAGGTGCGDFVVDLTQRVSVSSTGGFSKANYILLQREGQGLKAGPNVLWLCTEGSYFNIDSFMMTAYNPQDAYEGVPAAVPGLIEAERFDVGGEGVAYTDTTPGNIGNALRLDEDVDVYHLGNGFIVGSTAAGEYLRYTVDVTEDVETFLYSFRVASDRNTGKFRIVAGGTGCGDFVVDLTQRVSVSSTGGFSKANYILLQREGQGLKAGPNVLWLCTEGSYFNIDSFMMTAYNPQDAYEGVPAAVPGLIEAERFDVGGEGVAYTDTTPGNIGNALRLDEDVDVYHLGNGFIVGSTAAGEYLRYTVDVTEDVETFLYSFRVASDRNTGKFRIVAGGTGCGDFVVDLTQRVSVSSTGGFSKANYILLQREGQGLKAGPNVLWLCTEGSYFNIDSFTMTAYDSPTP